MDSESLTYLLSGGHYNVPDRIARGIWPHAPLSFEAIVQHLAKVISEQDWFPCEAKSNKPGQPVDEFGVIERVAPNRFHYHASRAYALDPCSVAQSNVTVFDNAGAAARHYLTWSLHLPGDLDSWKVI